MCKTEPTRFDLCSWNQKQSHIALNAESRAQLEFNEFSCSFQRIGMKEWNGSTIQTMQKKLQNSAWVFKKKLTNDTFMHILLSVSLFLCLFGNPFHNILCSVFCNYCKSETKECSGKYVNDLFYKVYGSGQVQANKW